MGVVTETTKARLQELEAEQREVLSSLLAEKRSIPDVTRDHVQFFFESFRNGDVDSMKYQKTLIKHFLRAVYLYDDHIKITFDYDDSDTGVEIPLEDSSAESSEDTSVLIDSLGVYQRRSSCKSMETFAL